ncbi:radical SAM/SPASM domain-containing protein [Pseudodesulfovibrio sp.]|uniref:radical SAM/SPASM domain-containing protein n=1 Tax=unclassified Pseudodesulfovibrio TaxID=2661612 RepID=UPI003AFF7C3A
MNIIKNITQIFHKQDSTKGKRPRQVILEPTNRCNLNCPFCLVGMQNDLEAKHGNVAHDLLSRPMGFMSPEVFEKVRTELKKFGIKSVLLHFQGEPFLNKHTPEFAKQLKADGMEVGVFTNGQIFTDDMIRRVVEARFDLIRFSVDGASEATYQVNRVGGTFAKVHENMRKVAEAHKELPTRVEWQFLPLRNNEHEVETARAMAEEIGVIFFTKGFRESVSDLAPTNPDYRCSKHQKPCTDPYFQLGIYWNGDIVPCCYDVDGKEIMGNLLKDSLEDIWNSERYTRFRECVDNVKKNPENEPEICVSCLRWE